MPHGKKLHQLTALSVQSLNQPGWHADGGGLYLEVTASGAKRWALRLTAHGKTRDFGLGSLAKVSLKDARETAAEYRAKMHKGIDPVGHKKPAEVVKRVPTLSACAHDVHRLRKVHQTNGKHIRQWISQLEQYVLPEIGAKPVNEITSADVLAVLSPIWGSKQETARRIRQKLHVILDWARAAGHRSGDNPVELIGEALPKQKKRARHFTALPYNDVPRFVRDLRAGSSEAMSKLAFEFLILTAARTGKVRFARRTEIDLAAKLWTIPGDDPATGRRMKSGRDHVVPLTHRMIEIVEQATALVPDSALLFPDETSRKVMSENRFLVVRDALGYAGRCTPHGFRSSFRDWVSEETHFSGEVAEMALAHVIKSDVEAAYRRGVLLTKRRELMEAWGAFAAQQPAPVTGDTTALPKQS